MNALDDEAWNLAKLLVERKPFTQAAVKIITLAYYCGQQNPHFASVRFNSILELLDYDDDVVTVKFNDSGLKYRAFLIKVRKPVNYFYDVKFCVATRMGMGDNKSAYRSIRSVINKYYGDELVKPI